MLKVGGIVDVIWEPAKVSDVIIPSFLFPMMIGRKRAVAIRGEAARYLAEAMERRLGRSVWQAFLYHLGKEYGKWGYKSHVETLGKRDINKLVILAEELFKSLGFGILRVEHMDTREKLCIVKIWRSFECELMGEMRRGKTSHFIRGMVAGWFSELMNEEMFCEEVGCVNEGRQYCEFKALPLSRQSSRS